MGWLDPDLGVLEHAVLAEETGFGLLPAPLFATVGLAWPLLDDELRAGVASGERSATIASAGDVQASGDRLTGVRTLVPDLTSVTDVVVPTTDGVFVVDVAAQPDVVVPRSTMDRTRRLGELRLDAAPGPPGGGGPPQPGDGRRPSPSWGGRGAGPAVSTWTRRSWTTYGADPCRGRPARRSASRSAHSTSPASTRRAASSSAGSSAPTRGCRTGSPTSSSRCSWAARSPTGRPGRW